MIPLLVMAHSSYDTALGRYACVASPQSVGRFCRFWRETRGRYGAISGGLPSDRVAESRVCIQPLCLLGVLMYPAGRVHCDEFRRDELDFSGARAGKRSFSPLYVFAAGRDWRAVLFMVLRP